MANNRLKPWPYPRWIAHRGGGSLAPENTLAAFGKGAEHGYRMFECDAQISADDVVFLMHDAALERTTNGHGMAREQSWQQLSQWDAGSWYSPEFKDERLPSLADIGNYCLQNGYFLNIEIKPSSGLEFKTGEIVAREALQIWRQESVPPVLTSFQIEALKGARQAAPHFPRGLLLSQLSDQWLAAAIELGCSAVVCQYALWTPEVVRVVHRAGMRCLSYTVNDERAAQHLIKLGTDGIITDKLDFFSPAV